VIRRSNNASVGRFGLKRLAAVNVVRCIADHGYRLLHEHWGQGYAAEVGSACLELGSGRSGSETISGRVAPENVASVRVFQTLGMRFWKTDVVDHVLEALICRVERVMGVHWPTLERVVLGQLQILLP